MKQGKEFLRQLRDAGQSPNGRTLIRFFEIEIESAKEKLVDAKPIEVEKLQGFIKHTRRVIKTITKETGAPQKNGAYSG